MGSWKLGLALRDPCPEILQGAGRLDVADKAQRVPLRDVFLEDGILEPLNTWTLAYDELSKNVF